MLLSQELPAEGATEMAGKRFTNPLSPEAGPTGLEAGLISWAGLVEEAGPIGEVEPVGLQVGPVSRLGRARPTHPSPATKACTYLGSGARTGQPPPSRDRRLLLPSSEEGFRRSRRPPAAAAAAASSKSPSSKRRAL